MKPFSSSSNVMVHNFLKNINACILHQPMYKLISKLIYKRLSQEDIFESRVFPHEVDHHLQLTDQAGAMILELARNRALYGTGLVVVCWDTGTSLWVVSSSEVLSRLAFLTVLQFSRFDVFVIMNTTMFLRFYLSTRSWAEVSSALWTLEDSMQMLCLMSACEMRMAHLKTAENKGESGGMKHKRS